MVKDDWTPPWYCRPEYHLKCFNFRFSLDMVKDDWTISWHWRPGTVLISDLAGTESADQNITLKFTFSLHGWLNFRFSLDMVKDDWLHSQVLQTRISPNFFIFRFSLDMVKDDWSLPRYCRPEYHLIFFKFRFSLDMVKDDWTPPRYCRPEYHLKCFNFRFSLDMVKDDWTSTLVLQTRISPNFF